MASVYNAFAQIDISSIPRALLLIFLGLLIGRLLSASLNKMLKNRLTVHQITLLSRVAFYIVFILFLISAVQELGFHLGALLGATGILTVAVGIASQTSMSNLISGIFIIGEKPFEIGDTIKINDITGEVMAIEFFSVKIRTKDNLMVRIPNETLIKTAIVNISYFPIRRVDLTIGVAYKEDVNRVRKVLMEIADKNTLALDEPKPIVYTDQFGDSAVILQFCVWVNRNKCTEAKSELLDAIKLAFAENEIEIPYPTHSLHASSATQPLPVKLYN